MAKHVRLYVMAPNNTVLWWTNVYFGTAFQRKAVPLSASVVAGFTNYSDIRLQFTKWHSDGDPTTIVMKKVELVVVP